VQTFIIVLKAVKSNLLTLSKYERLNIRHLNEIQLGGGYVMKIIYFNTFMEMIISDVVDEKGRGEKCYNLKE